MCPMANSYDLRESRTVLGARGGVIPPRDSPGRAQDRRGKHWLWRAVDQTGAVLDVLVQRRRDKRAAERPTAQTIEKADAAAPRNDHRQAGQLWGGEKGGDARR
jgi:hypothetical protein